MIVDWTKVERPYIRLTLHRSRGGWYSVTDQDGRLFFPPSELAMCLRFMKAMAEKRDAVIDDASVEMATWADAHSVRVPDNVVPIRRGA